MMRREESAAAWAADDGSGAAGGGKGDKVRVYQLAKEHSVSSEAMVKIVRDLGVEVKSHMSSVDASIADQVRRQLDKEKEAVKEDFARKREVDRASRRRAQAKTAPAPAEGGNAPKAPEPAAVAAKAPPAKRKGGGGGGGATGGGGGGSR
ncbi:MAG: translation initiation factor IF-2 N-terminal domain-containing protein, partial [Gemmatimonadetes bacterium]|nr:translation initiation factor IF-2 N-terminal domain-containing protein [Gemmatimonadota bacterium]